MQSSSLVVFKWYVSQVRLPKQVVASIRQTLFGHFLDSLDLGVDAYMLDNIVGRWEIGNMSRFNGIDLWVTKKDFGKVFSIPYQGAYNDLEAEAKIDYTFFKKHLDGFLLHRYG